MSGQEKTTNSGSRLQRVVERNIALTGQFTRHLLEHPSLFAALPDQFELVLLPQNDTELQLYNLRLLEKFDSEGRPVVLARLHSTGVDMTHQPPLQIYVPLVA